MLNTPWKLKELTGKYYGTIIVDADDTRIADVWLPSRNDEEWQPSPRSGYEEDEICDNHYENVRTYDTAMAIVNRVNYLG